MQVIEHHDIPEVESLELPALQPGQCSICTLIFRQHVVNSEVKLLNGKHTKDIIRPEKLSTVTLMLMVMP